MTPANSPRPSTPHEPVSVRAFRESLGDDYAARYDAATIAIHARIAQERGDALVNLGSFDLQHRPQIGVCVVAKDAPGLLATITAAFVTSGFDISSAEAYTRQAPSGEAEAVDIFWVFPRPPEHPSSELEASELDRLHTTLVELLQGRQPALPRPQPITPARSIETMVRFLESDDGTFTTLEVETDDRSGLLQSLASALFAARVQINSSQVRTNGQRVYDRFKIVEVDGSPISAERRLEIQVAVLGAVDPSLTV